MIAIEHGMVMACKCKSVVACWPFLCVSDQSMHVPLQTMTSVIMLTMMLVGGFYVTDLPSWISWMKVRAGLSRTLTLLYMYKLLSGLPAALHG